VPSAGPRRLEWQDVTFVLAKLAPADVHAREPLEPVGADVEERRAEIAHEPLVCAARGKVDAARFDVDGDRSGGLDDVRVDQRIVCVCQRAQLTKVMLETGHARDE
jgi:hypothetical protein